MLRMERSKACFAKAVSLSNVTDLRRAGLIRPNTASRTEMVSAAVFPASLVARVTRDFRSCRSFMQDAYGPRALADDEVAFPVTHGGAAFDVPWPIVDGGAVFDHVAGGSRPAQPAALVTAGQIAPQFLALASGAIDEGVDGFEPQGAQAALMAGLEPAGDLLRCPYLRRGDHRRSPSACDPVRGRRHAVCAVDRLRRRRAANSGHWARRFGATPATRWIWPAPPPWRWRRSNGQPPSAQRFDLVLHPADANSLAWQHSRRS